MEPLTLPCTMCGPTAPVEICESGSLVRCAGCRTEHVIERQALYLRDRLRRRPLYDEARIEPKVAAARVLRAEADRNLDVSGDPPTVVVARVREWLGHEGAIDR